MNTSGANMIFPQLVFRQPQVQDAETRFRSVTLPAGPTAQEIFYRALPCVGWAVRETNRTRPETGAEKVLRFSLATLRESLPNLAHIAAETRESEVLHVLKTRLQNVYGEMKWQSPPAAADETAAPGQDARTRKLVLIVEDDPVTRFHLCVQLRQCGYAVEAAESGADALLMTALVSPDIVLLDLHMDGLDGRQTCAWLKASRFTSGRPVVFLSGESAPDLIQSALDAGAADFLLKPFTREISLPRIEFALGGCEPEPPSGKFRCDTSAADNRPGGFGASAANSFSTPSEGRTTPGVGLRRTLTDVAPVLSLVVWIVSPIAKRRQIRLQLDAPESGLVASCDELRIQCVLESLLSRAVKASPAGSVITLGAHHEQEHLVISINGKCATVIDPADSTSKAASGISTVTCSSETELASNPSLEICQQIIAAHGGVIYTRNGAGADYFFSLPAVFGLPSRQAQVFASPGQDNLDIELAAAS